HRLEDGLQALIRPAALRLLHQQELVVRRLLNLNEVRHLRDFLDFSEKFPNALSTDKRLRHLSPLAQSIHQAWAGRLKARPEPFAGSGIAAIKTTLQRAAIHRDRRDRRRNHPIFRDSVQKSESSPTPQAVGLVGDSAVTPPKSPISTVSA
ncbi:MAG TPA: hypothetical protein VEJ37_06315, partial [Xanthobacteraceae bacterium]|nr:hypothetical protein [Xanthobacteraceae bacterium]